MPILKLTDRTIANLKPSADGRTEYRDSLLPSFGLRVSSNGVMSFGVAVRILRAGTWRLTRVTLGRYPGVSLIDARQKARDVIAAAQAGHDPSRIQENEQAARERASRDTFAAVRDRFLASCKGRLRASTYREYERVLKSSHIAAWDTWPVSSITKRNVVELIDSLATTAPMAANRTLAYLRALFNWAAGKDLIETPPTDHVKPPAKEVSRDRMLSGDDIKTLWPAFDAAGVFGPGLKLALLTGQRRGEIAGMRWDELRNLDSAEPLWDIPATKTKNGRPHAVPLSPMTVGIIKAIEQHGEFVFGLRGPFSGFSHAKARVDDSLVKAGAVVKEWHIHDLRRTAATHMAELGTRHEVIELVLNHTSGSRGGIVGVYNRSELMPERRRALDRWSQKIAQLIAPPQSAVILKLAS